MELVGNYISVVECDEVVLMDFRCTNKEIFRDILVPPILRHMSSGLLRIFLGRNPEEKGAGLKDQWILRHWEEM